MPSINPDIQSPAAMPVGVGDAVGVHPRQWFVAIVNNNTEKSVEERLMKLQFECYVAKQSVVRVWNNGRRAIVDKVVIPSLVFIKCTEKERREIVALPFINRFMTDRAAATGQFRRLAVIPQRQIDTLRFMLGQSNIPISFTESPFKVCDRVKVIRGDLKGIEGEVIQAADGRSEVVVRIAHLGAARMTIDSVDLELAG